MLKGLTIGLFAVCMATPAFAGNSHALCHDGRGNPHTCFAPEDGSIMHKVGPVVKVPVSKNPIPEHFVTAKAQCEPGQEAFFEGYDINPTHVKIGAGFWTKIYAIHNINESGVECDRDDVTNGFEIIFFNRGAQTTTVDVRIG